MPLDVVVRVDVSPWADPSAFTIFADNQSVAKSDTEHILNIERGATSD
jgi:hypothetical protein